MNVNISRRRKQNKGPKFALGFPMGRERGNTSVAEKVGNQESLISLNGGRAARCHLQGCDTGRSFQNRVSKMECGELLIFIVGSCDGAQRQGI